MSETRCASCGRLVNPATGSCDRCPDASLATKTLTTPTYAGQTRQLTAVGGPEVANATWPELPYYIRTAWEHGRDNATETQVARYLSDQASPVALAIAAENEELGAETRALARERLDEMAIGDDELERLRKHFSDLIRQSRNRLLKLTSTGERADPALDRLDLLAEVVALRSIRTDLRSERTLVRAFRSMFEAREAWTVWGVVGACVAVFLLVKAGVVSGTVEDRLALWPDLRNPWAVVTHVFVHVGWLHVVLNMLALVLVGQIPELVLGHSRFALALLGCALAGAAGSLVFKNVTGVFYATMGASGAIAGIGGMALVLGLWFQSRYGRIPLRYVTGTLLGSVVLVSNLLITATAAGHGTDHGAHLGGLLCGLLFGLLLRGRLAERVDQRFGVRG